MMFKRIIVFTVFILFCTINISGRDIDLDSVYLAENSPVYKKLIHGKSDAYNKVDAVKISGNVIFARWVGGNNIVYIREFPAVNILYIYTLNGKSKELLRIPGTVTTMLIDPENRYLHIKHLTIEKNSPVPLNRLLTVDLKTNKTQSRLTNNPFLDFSLPPNGSSLVFESKQGINEEFTETGLVRLLIPAADYSRIIGKNSYTIALFSPNRTRCLLLNGSGSGYKTHLWGGSGQTPAVISSAEEISWLDNDSIIYRSGYSGNYSITVESLDGKIKRQLVKNSLNTNLCLSPAAGRAAFLHNQMIILYNIKDNSMVNTGLEGEDIFFSPNGVFFISIFQKELFLIREKTLLERKNHLKTHGNGLLQLYQQAASDNNALVNEYSKNYCTQKIKTYSAFLETQEK